MGRSFFALLLRHSVVAISDRTKQKSKGRTLRHRWSHLEALESRILLTTYAMSDFFPLTNGVTWSYNGTVDGEAATSSASVVSGPTMNGKATKRLYNNFTTLSGSGTLSRYYSLDSSGLLIHRETFPEWDETYIGAFTLLPATVTTNTDYALAASYNGTGLGGNYTGSLTGTFTVHDIESVVTPAGTFEALNITFSDSYAEVGSGYTENGTGIEDLWLLKGVGIVRQDLSKS